MIYDINLLKQETSMKIKELISEPKYLFHNVIEKVESDAGGLVFLNAPGRTGKTFLINLLLSAIRSEN